MFVTLWLHCPVAIDKSLTQSESPSCAPEVETGYFIQTSAVNVKCSPVEISCGGAWQGCLYTEVVLLCLMQPDTTDFPEPCCPEVADACSEESRVCVSFPICSQVTMALDLLQGCTRDQIGFLAQSGLPQESNVVLPGTIFYNLIRRRSLQRLEPSGRAT